MKVFLAGATGATGRLLAGLLLNRGHEVVTVIRSVERLPEGVRKYPSLRMTEANLLDLPEEQLVELTSGCDAIVSCLGHNLSFRGIFGPPYRLVAESALRLSKAAAKCDRNNPVRFILMSSAGIRNAMEGERISLAENIVIRLLRLLVPPHADNEAAAEILNSGGVPGCGGIEWVAVRPDSLVDESKSSAYTLHRSPTRSATFNSGKTSRINVAHFMADLIEQDALWNQWKGKMPVIYNGQ